MFREAGGIIVLYTLCPNCTDVAHMTGTWMISRGLDTRNTLSFGQCCHPLEGKTMKGVWPGPVPPFVYQTHSGEVTGSEVMRLEHFCQKFNASLEWTLNYFTGSYDPQKEKYDMGIPFMVRVSFKYLICLKWYFEPLFYGCIPLNSVYEDNWRYIFAK